MSRVATSIGCVALAVGWREAGRLLGIDRNRDGTLGELVRLGYLHPIPWGRGTRFSVEELQELARTGWRLSGRPVRRTTSARRGTCDPGALRKLRGEDL